jgi:hypothetical protein
MELARSSGSPRGSAPPRKSGVRVTKWNRTAGGLSDIAFLLRERNGHERNRPGNHSAYGVSTQETTRF